jgi:hypothetical protein
LQSANNDLAYPYTQFCTAIQTWFSKFFQKQSFRLSKLCAAQSSPFFCLNHNFLILKTIEVMKVAYYFFILITVSTLFLSHRYDTVDENGRAGSTGSTGETTCANCHGGTGSGSISLTSYIPPSGFVAGGTYNVSVTVSEAGKSLFGLGVEALTSTNTNAGTLGIINAAETQLKARTIGGVSRQNVVHQFNGGATPNAKTFTFRWTAPANPTGNVTFYYSGISANGNGQDDAGDNTYTSSTVFSAQVVVVCPTLTTAPANVSIVNSVCNASCQLTNGSITAPSGTPCPTGSNLRYSVNGGAWTATLPTYTPSVQSIQTRCSCESDPAVNSPASTVVTTAPATCPTEGAPTLSIVNNVPPSTTGSISATGCGVGTVVEYATAQAGPYSTTAPTYTLSPITVYARCRNTKTGCVSPSVSGTTVPVAASVVTLNCLAPITATAATGATSAIVTFTDPIGTSTCTTGSVTPSRTNGLASGSAFPIGKTNVCFTATDGCGTTKSFFYGYGEHKWRTANTAICH